VVWPGAVGAEMPKVIESFYKLRAFIKLIN